MVNIEIKGVQFSNKGAELMLVAILEQLDKEFSSYQITLSPGRYLPYKKRALLGAWQKLSFRRGKIDLTGVFSQLPQNIRNFLKRYGIVTEKDIDIILDASGFSYGDQWGEKSLFYAAKEIKRLKKQGKKYIFLPQAFGPFTSTKIKKLAVAVFSQADLVFTRDESSYKEIMHLKQSFKDANHIMKSPDFTCLVEPKNKILDSKKDQKIICLIPNNKMFSKFHHANANDDQKKYLDFFIQIGCFYQEKGWKVVLLNHEGDEDQLVCQKISQKLSIEENVTIYQGLSAVDIKSLIGAMDAVFSSRFHGCVSALTQGVPCLATSWSHKYQMLFQEYGMRKNVIDFKMTHLQLTNELNEFNQSLDAQTEQCNKHSLIVKKETKFMWKKVFSTINKENK